MAKVSIIVPVYNAELYIKECVESILKQSYADIEVLLINDGSTDESSAICKSMECLDSRVRTYDKDNSGVSSTRNFGINISESEYIMFVDADDTIDSATVEDNLRLIEETNSDFVFFGFRYCILDEKKVHENELHMFCGSGQDFFNECFATLCAKEALNPPWNKIIRRSLINKIGVCFDEDISICEDMLFTTRLLSKCSRVAVNEKVYYNYRIKSFGSLVFSYHRNYLEAATRAFEEATAYCSTFANNYEQISEVRQRYVTNVMAHVKRLCRNDILSNKEKLDDIRLICEEDIFRQCLKKTHLCGKKAFVRQIILWKRYKLILTFYTKMRKK